MNELTTAAINLLKDLIATPFFRKRKKKRLTELVNGLINTVYPSGE